MPFLLDEEGFVYVDERRMNACLGTEGQEKEGMDHSTYSGMLLRHDIHINKNIENKTSSSQM